MHDDLALLSLVIEAGSFTLASNRSGIPKSRLSRRVDELEKRLGVRLIDRSSRHFTATPIGIELARRGDAIRAEGDQALQIVQESLSKPTGALRIACPSSMAERVVAGFCIEFSIRYPLVTVTLDATDGTKPSSMESYDIAIIASGHDLADADMIARRIRSAEYVLVAAPPWLDRVPKIYEPADLTDLDAIDWWTGERHARLRLVSDAGEEADVRVRARFITNSLSIAYKAALQGLGMARIPLTICSEDLRSGQLRHVLSGWRPRTVSLHAIYRSRHSLQLAGRLFLDELMQHLRDAPS
jgi:DNA-binding transcriptional LysR family regulator